MWNDLLDHEHCFLYPLKKCKKQNANNELKLINSLLGKSFLSLFIFSHSFLYYCYAIYLINLSTGKGAITTAHAVGHRYIYAIRRDMQMWCGLVS